MQEAFYHFSERIGTRSKGHSAVASAAYRAGENLEVESAPAMQMAKLHAENPKFKRIKAARSRHYYAGRDGVLDNFIMAPKDAPSWVKDRQKLWNHVEDFECVENNKRWKQAQLYREITIAFPKELSEEERKKVLERFVSKHLVSRGMIADCAIHTPTKRNDDRNFHAHVMLTMRELDGDTFAQKKNTDWNKKEFCKELRAAWADELNAVLRDRGFFADHRSHEERGLNQVPTKPEGPKRQALDKKGIKTARTAYNDLAIEHNLENVMSRVTERQAVFTLNDIRAALHKAGAKRFVERQMQAKSKSKSKPKIDEDALKKATKDYIEKRIETLQKTALVSLRKKGRFSGVFTTKAIRATEENQMILARELRNRKGAGSAKASTIDAVLAEREGRGKKLFADQERVLRYVASQGDLKVVEGLAGTGKSFTMAAIRDVLEQEGRQVIGLSHTNTVVQDMVSDGFSRAQTVTSFLFSLEKGKQTIDKNTVLMVDEAAMLSLKQDVKLFSAVQDSGAKLVYIGDSGQLSSIERGGMFEHYSKIAKAERLDTVTRQREAWDRAAAKDFAEGRFMEGLLKYKKHARENVVATPDEASAMDILVREWMDDSQTRRSAPRSRFVFAYTNKQVDELNQRIHRAEIDAGLIESSSLQRFLLKTYAHNAQTGKREQAGTRSVDIGVGTRLQFREKNHQLGVFNGTMARVTGMEGENITVALDTPGAQGRFVTFNVNDYSDFDLGYAGTIYKGQGKTFDQAYVLFSKHWRRNAAYVTMTRSRQPTKLFYGRKEAKSLKILASQMGRLDNAKGPSLEFSISASDDNRARSSFQRSTQQRSFMAQDYAQAAQKKDQFWTESMERYADRSLWDQDQNISSSDHDGYYA